MTDAWSKGDLVVANPTAGFPSSVQGQVFEIDRVPSRNGVNYTARPRGNPQGRGLKGPWRAFVAYDPTNPPVAVEIPIAPVVGVAVTVAGVPKINPTHLYVVLGESRGHPDCVKIARLGGDGGMFWPRVPISMLTVKEDVR